MSLRSPYDGRLKTFDEMIAEPTSWLYRPPAPSDTINFLISRLTSYDVKTEYFSAPKKSGIKAKLKAFFRGCARDGEGPDFQEFEALKKARRCAKQEKRTEMEFIASRARYYDDIPDLIESRQVINPMDEVD